MAEPVESLPTRFPVFPLRGALLLPGGNLPLNIFEPRYLRMVQDALRTDRVIGMIQPRDQGAAESEPGAPELFRTGCCGRISNFAETPDGRYEIVLTGVCRFDVAEELEVDTPYRQVVGDFARWRHDLQPEPPPAGLKGTLLAALRAYFERHGIDTDWEAIDTAPFAGLVTSLCMICPFEPNEKQALLEAGDLTRQAKLLVALMQMDALAGEAGPGSAARH
jgi:Lon protease-like protein